MYSQKSSEELIRLDEMISARVEALFEKLTGQATEQEIEEEMALIDELVQSCESRSSRREETNCAFCGSHIEIKSNLAVMLNNLIHSIWRE